MKNIKLQLRRAIKAIRMGFIWPGATRFVLPNNFRWRGRRFVVNSPDLKTEQGSFRSVLVDDEYGIQQLSFVPRTVLDVGANIGMFSLWAAANFPAATIHAYEPSAALSLYLKLNLSQTGALPCRAAVAGRDGMGSLTASTHTQICKVQYNVCGDVPIVSLQTAVDRMGGFVDLLKLDCEGSEWSILEQPDAFRTIKFVRMEYHNLQDGQTTERLVGLFEDMGFVSRHVAGNEVYGLAWFDKK